MIEKIHIRKFISAGYLVLNIDNFNCFIGMIGVMVNYGKFRALSAEVKAATGRAEE